MRALNNMAARQHVSLLQTEQCKLEVRTVPKSLLYGHSSQAHLSRHGWQRLLPKHRTSICLTAGTLLKISKAVLPCARWGAFTTRHLFHQMSVHLNRHLPAQKDRLPGRG